MELANYERTLALKVMEDTATTSSNFPYRLAMLYVLEKMFLPRTYLFYCTIAFWLKGKFYYFIDASRLADFGRHDLDRLRWMENFRVITLYLFLPRDDTGSTLQVDGQLLPRNQAVYRNALKVLPANRIAILGRSIPKVVEGFPALPDKYKLLQMMEDPTVYQEVEWTKFHHDLYKDLAEDH